MSKPHKTPSPQGRRSGSSQRKHKTSAAKLPAWLKWATGGLVLPVVFGLLGYKMHQDFVVLPGKVVTKSALPTVLPADAYDAKSSGDMFWGTYRSNLYFGMRARTPRSPVVGLMWFEQSSSPELQFPKIRHWCDQNDGLRYSWLKHDGRSFGFQQIQDQKIHLNTSFVKKPGGPYGGDWTARISAAPVNVDDPRPHMHSLLVYVALGDIDNDGSNLRPLVKTSDDNQSPFVTQVHGFTPELGHFTIKFTEKPPNTVARAFMATRIEPKIDLTHMTELMISSIAVIKTENENLRNYLALMGYVPPGSTATDRPNIVAVQVTFVRATELEIQFESRDNPARVNSLKGTDYDAALVAHIAAFDDKFEKTFKLKEKNYPSVYEQLGQSALSNMLGSIGYFHGSSKVMSQYTPKPVPYGPLTLFTTVPSRPFFPRGFLWDEGFHHLLLHRFDMELSLEILGSWLDLMNEEGWIPREMVLGPEAESKVPPEYIVQHNSVANPPVFFYLLGRYLQKEDFVEKHKPYLEKIFPRLQVWYNWLNSSQVGSSPGSYRWRGRNATTDRELNPKTLPSGLDDYPRASHPTDDEYHVDLYCWMAVSSKAMAKIADVLESPEVDRFTATAETLTDQQLLDELHWSEKFSRYCDYGLHTRAVELQKPKPVMGQDGRPRPPPDPQMFRVVLREPAKRLVTDTFGYVSLYPFFHRLISPDSPKLGRVLDQLTDVDLLWSPYGLRSLAKSSPLYDTHNTEHDPPYWRGHIWLNMNYLALSALRYYADASSDHAELAYKIYTELRANVVGNVVKNFHRTGFLWEHYNDQTGDGEGCHPFTGWSSLVLLMLAEEYDS